MKAADGNTSDKPAFSQIIEKNIQSFKKAVEHKYTQLKNLNMHFLNQKKKPYQKPTTRWIFFCFLGLHLAFINRKKTQVTNLKERHRIILHCLGPPYELFYYAEKWNEK